MPMYFGWKAHRDHDVPMRRLRSGKQMQEDFDKREERCQEKLEFERRRKEALDRFNAEEREKTKKR